VEYVYNLHVCVYSQKSLRSTPIQPRQDKLTGARATLLSNQELLRNIERLLSTVRDEVRDSNVKIFSNIVSLTHHCGVVERN
jgi:hypothetical protein